MNISMINMTVYELLVFDRNTWNYIIVCKQMIIIITYLGYQGLIWHSGRVS